VSETRGFVRDDDGRIWHRGRFEDDVSVRRIRSSRGLELMVRMARFHTEGRCVVNVWRLGACARALASCVVGPTELCVGGGLGVVCEKRGGGG